VPDETGRLEVLRIHTKNMKLDDEVRPGGVLNHYSYGAPLSLIQTLRGGEAKGGGGKGEGVGSSTPRA
jgi:SpoVK/Ycf46/Vps4 family AAA+-type ATPase